MSTTAAQSPTLASTIVFPETTPSASGARSTAEVSDVGDRWIEFGMATGEGPGSYRLPGDVVAFEACDAMSQTELRHFLVAMETPPKLSIKLGGRQVTFFRLADHSLAEVLARSVPEAATCLRPSDLIQLPEPRDWTPGEQSARSVADLSVLTAVEVSRVAQADFNSAQTVISKNPLLGYSLLGLSSAFRERAIAATPLLGNLCLSGQVTAWYAAPNTGKTLIALNLLIEAVREGRIAAGNVFYVNADDTSEGMATKMELTDDLGVHSLTPGYNGFSKDQLIPKLQQMAAEDKAKGVFVLIDTTKKFASLMDKKESSVFADACRRVAMGGGAVLNLAHTTKAPNADGSPRYAGTTDLVDDSDAVYTIRSLDIAAGAGERVVEFNCIKQRGDNAKTAAYAYAAETGITYAERLSSVREVDPASLDSFKRVEARKADEDVIAIIAACIGEGFNTKMILRGEVAKRAGVSGREALKLVERYTGGDPDQHRWRFTVRERGAKVFELLSLPST